MATKSRDIRATPRRVAELQAEIAALEARLLARIELLERDDSAKRLAEEIGKAALRTLKPKGSPQT